MLIFPEGARSCSGQLQPFRDGARLIIRRAKCPVVPIAIEGAFETWPRTQKRPRLFGCRVAIEYGEPISPERARADDGNELLERTIDTMRLALRDRMREKTKGKFPPPSDADQPLHIG